MTHKTTSTTAATTTSTTTAAATLRATSAVFVATGTFTSARFTLSVSFGLAGKLNGYLALDNGLAIKFVYGAFGFSWGR